VDNKEEAKSEGTEPTATTIQPEKPKTKSIKLKQIYKNHNLKNLKLKNHGGHPRTHPVYAG
jgi:hypothetical protein